MGNFKKIMAVVLSIAAILSAVSFSAYCAGATSGDSETEPIIVSHDLKEWQYDEDGHWRACNDCSDIFDIEPHRFNSKGVCKCGYVTDAIEYGNANGDDAIDMKDIVLLRNYLAEYNYETQTSTVAVEPGADANGDGTIDMKDIVLLRNYLAEYDYETGTSPVPLGPQE